MGYLRIHDELFSTQEELIEMAIGWLEDNFDTEVTYESFREDIHIYKFQLPNETRKLFEDQKEYTLRIWEILPATWTEKDDKHFQAIWPSIVGIQLLDMHGKIIE